MSNHITFEKETGNCRRATKCYAIMLTMVYTVFFPFFFYVALLSGMVMENPKTTVPIGLSMMFAMFWIPLSMPVSIYLMWSNFSNHKYRRTLYWGGLPPFIFVLALLIVDGILPLFRV